MTKMLTTDAIAKTYLFATGKTSSLTAGGTKYTRILSLLDSAVQDWADEPGVEWDYLRTIATLDGTVTATDTFELIDDEGEDIENVSDQEGDYVIIERLDGGETRYTTVTGDRLNEYDGNVCAIVGDNLVFPEAFTTDSPEYGGTIKIPHYPPPAELEAAADEYIPCPRPNFVCYMAAAEYARTDLVNQGQYGNLVAKAQPIMQKMLERNVGQSNEVYSPELGVATGQTWD